MTYEQATITRDSLISLGLPIPPEISQIIADYEKDIESSATPIYDTLKRHSKFPVTKEKEECVVGTVNDLLSDEQDAANPGLLLGKIQCGKTDTFNNGKFPFIVRGFKYLILRAGATDNQSRMVFELYPREYWPIVPVQQFDENGFLIDYLDGQKLIVATDTVTNTLGDKTDIANKNVCQWVIKFRIKKILAYTPAPKVKD